MTNLIRIIGLLLLPLLSYSQGPQQRITVPISNNGTDSALFYLPDDYSRTSASYPLLIFLHGLGEAGNNLSLIFNSVSSGGPSNLIATNKWPSSFINPISKQATKFIVISPQAKSGGYVTGDDCDIIIQYLVKTYRVDVSRIFFIGLSQGGGGALEYMAHLTPDQNNVTTHTRKYLPAATILLSGAFNRPLAAWATIIVSDSVHVLGTGSPNNDVWGEFTQTLISYITGIKSSFGIFIDTKDPNHCCWNNIFTPSYIVPGTTLNIYQWLLQFQAKGMSTPIQPPPVVVPPIKAVLLQDSTVLNPPHSVIVLTDSTRYADTTNPGGSYLQVSGPTKAIFTPGTGRQMYVSNLQPGSYRFELLAMNGDTGKYTLDSAFVNVTVKPMPVCPVCPPPIVCPPQRTATSVGVLIGGNLFILPMSAVKIGYSDGNSTP